MAFLRARLLRLAPFDLLRSVVVIGCAVALILARGVIAI